MNWQVLQEELMELRADFFVPPSYPILLVSAENCLVATDEVRRADPELRLLAGAVFQNGDAERLVRKVAVNEEFHFESLATENILLVFTFPAAFQYGTTVMRIARRMVRQYKMRGLAAQKLQRLELRAEELWQQIEKQQQETRKNTVRIVREWVAENTVPVTVTPEVIELLGKDTASGMRSRLTASLQLEEFLNPGRKSYEITPECLQPELQPALTKQPAVKEKSALLLDRYEAAALKALEKGLKPSGRSIALCCEPPVSPPAVTDSLQKYRRQIEHLLTEHPARWINARRALKPLREIDEKLKYSAA